MAGNEDKLGEAERHVREGEQQIARLKAQIAKLENDGHFGAAEEPRRLLATFEQTQRLHVEHLELERAEKAEKSN